jgi:outer membrane receptor protein involved in Fe transport
MGPLFSNVGFEVVTSYNNQLYKFEDPNVNYYKYLDYDDSKLNTFSVNFKAFTSFNDLKITSGYGFEKGDLSDIKTALSNNRKETSLTRDIHRISAGLRYSPDILPALISNFSISGGVNVDISSQKGIGKNEESQFSYSTGISASPAFFNSILLKAHYFKTTRIPSFNEYYYSSVFSVSDLLPERTNGFEAGFIFKNEKIIKGELSAVYFRIETEDKIIWVPSMIALQVPRNIAKTLSSGIELSLAFSVFSDALQFSTNYVYLNSENISPFGPSDKSNGKQLLYSPKHRLNTSITYTLNGFSVTLGHRASSESFYTFDNDALSTIKGNSVFDLKTTCHFDLFKVGHTISLSVYNLFNENYRLIQSYPMPLRTVILFYSINI